MISYQLTKWFAGFGHEVDTITEGRGCYRRGKVAFLDESGKKMLRSHPDIVQVVGPTPIFSEQCVKYAKKQDLPLVYQVNAFPGLSTYYHNRAVGLIDYLYKRLNLYRQLRRADLLVFQTMDFAEYFMPFHDRPFEVIPHGLDADELNEFNGYSENHESSSNGILFVGQLRRYKGLPYLIRAVKQLRETGRDVVLDIAGDGPDFLRIEDLILKLNLENAVFLRGGQSRRDLNSLYRRSRVLVLPSIEGESFGIVLLEAAARGVPVIASDLPGVREVANSLGGTVVPPRDSEALAKAIEEVLDDSQEPSAGMIPVGFTRFLWENIAREYLRSYGKLLGIESDSELFPAPQHKQKLELAEVA